jgi:hypothetical protein
MTAEIRAIYELMPPQDRARVDRIQEGTFRDLTIRLWAQAQKQELMRKQRARPVPPKEQERLPLPETPAPPDPDDDWRNRF